jgi:hypothetical protein
MRYKCFLVAFLGAFGYKIIKMEIIPCVITDHYGIKVEINGKENYKSNSNSWRLNNIL